MGLFNPSDNCIHLKIVYYGPACGGKTTNLTRVKALLDPAGEQSVLSINTDRDTTLFFDYLPLRFRLLDHYAIRVQGYTVPGQVKFDTTRRLVLKGADAVIFVADSTRPRLQENVDSLLNLYSNLAKLGMDAGRVPIVLQYNKQDCEDRMEPGSLDRFLNQQGHPWIGACALRGEGVFETFRSGLGQVVARLHQEYQLDRRGLTVDQALGALDASLNAAHRDALAQNADDQTEALQQEAQRQAERTILRVEGRSGPSLLDDDRPESLLEGAVAANLELAALVANLCEQRAALARELDEVKTASQDLLHELKGPLTVLRNVMHIAGVGEAKAGEPAKLAGEAVADLEARIAAHGTRLKQTPAAEHADARVPLEDVAQDVLRRLAWLAHENAVELRLRDALPVALGARDAYASLFSNLIGNAVRYHDPARSRRIVEVRGRCVRQGFLIGIADNGRGIPADERPVVFEKGRRGAASAGIPGSGLGLYLVKQLATSLGARVGVRSCTGQGSLFYILLPASRLPSAAGAAGAAAASRASGTAAR